MQPNNSIVKVTLKEGKESSLNRFHPWVFSGAIEKIHDKTEEGDIVEVFDKKGNYLATGHCQIGSIAIRVFTFRRQEINYEFWKQKIVSAYDYRNALGLINNNSTNVYRLVYAEGDGLPGLIIDYFSGTAVIQTYTVGMHLLKDVFKSILIDLYGKRLVAIYDKSVETMPSTCELDVKNGYLFGEKNLDFVLEYNHKFLIDWELGQKTGFFIDQRENRKLLSLYSKDRNVLNTFCYTGGFSVYALKAGAKIVHSVDSSKRATELCDLNIKLNANEDEMARHSTFAQDTFEYLKNNSGKYDIIILDPPAFAKHHEVSHNAVMGYKRLNMEAIRQIKPGGIIFTFSCSQVIKRQLFNNTVMAAAIEARRSIRIMHHLSQPVDHPTNIFHPEGEYLKGLVIYVE